MTWPTTDVVTTAMDAGTDTPPRAEFLSWAQKFNQMRAHVSTFMQGLLESANAAAARTTLDVPTRTGGNASGSWGINVTGTAANVTGTVAIANGGTGATTAAAARTALGTNDAANLTTGNVEAGRIYNALNAAGAAPLFACRAWVNFNGTGAVAIRASGNVSSITDVGIGTYTINLTTALPDANYAANVTVGNPTVGTHGSEIKSDGVSASAMNIFTYGGASVADFPVVCVSIFR